MKSLSRLVLLPLLFLSVETASGEPPAFERLKTLVGKWKGEFHWTGARSGGGELDVEYGLTGNGSALIENQIGPSGSVMMTIYHPDGEDLRLTHFCAARNQPRMKVTRVSPDGAQLRFEMVDITNLQSPDASHTTSIEVELRGDDQVELTLTVLASGEESVEHLSLKRLE